MNSASPDLLEGEKVYLGLGSNLGSREENLKTALSGLEAMDGLAITAVSSLYETSPLGPQDQGLFLNAAAELNVAGPTPQELLERLGALETQMGRRRIRRWGPRIIDLDLLLWTNKVISTGRLCLPHPEMARRGFVLAPLAEIAPQAIHPVLAQTTAELLAELAPLGGVWIFKEGGAWSGF